MITETKLEEENRMYDAGYAAGIASVQSKYMEFRRAYIDGLQVLIDRATLKHEFDALAYARRLLRSLL